VGDRLFPEFGPTLARILGPGARGAPPGQPSSSVATATTNEPGLEIARRLADHVQLHVPVLNSTEHVVLSAGHARVDAPPQHEQANEIDASTTGTVCLSLVVVRG
jgi:hypothetical protein